jgi:hypothetical protein
LSDENKQNTLLARSPEVGMTLIELAACLAAAAFTVLVGFVVPVLINRRCLRICVPSRKT